MERYNAFISYRHSPTDIKVATEIQKQLERFHIPTAIRKATGMKKISRIFRDKEELSLTGDLNETIQNALNHSDFLILICSPAMKESFWVQKEIEYFLKTHSKRQILTVIADGEPCDVLPEILTYEEMVLPDENGNPETVKVPVEPLSCDYRMSFRKARREELPRLAAPIIGCSYDDLRRRQRQYRMRRMGVAFSAAALLLAGLSVYFAWSAKQIQNSLDQALINQSEYLASESRSLLKNGDRLSAVLLSLQALPQEEGERPVVPSAINALSQSTYAYVSPGNEKISLDYLISPGGRIDKFCIDSSETYLFFCYDTYHIAVWDLSARRMVFQTLLSTYIHQIAFSSQNQLLVLTDNQLKCLNPADGAMIWEFAPDADDLYGTFTLTSEGNIALFNFTHILLVDAQSGDLIQKISLPEEYSGQNIKEVVFSPDGSHMALYSSGLSEWVLIHRLSDSSFSSYTLEEGYFYQMRFGEDNTLYLAAANEAFTYFTTDENAMYSKDSGQLLKLDPQGNLIWQTGIDCFYESLFSQFYFADHTAEGVITPALMYCYSNLCCMYDINTGAELSRVEFLGSVIDAQQSDIGLRCLLSNGDYAICNSSAEVVRSTPCFISDNASGLLKDSIYILDASGKNVLVYRHNIWDDTWQNCCTLDTNYYGSCEKGILFSTDQFMLCLLDSTGRNILWEAETQVECNYFSVLGTVNNGKTAVLTMYGSDLQDVYQKVLCLVDLNTGEQQYLNIDDSLSYEEACLQNEKFYYLSSAYDEAFETHYYIVCIDLMEMQTEKTEVTLDNYTPNKLRISPSGKTIILWDMKGQCAVYKAGGFSRLGEPISEDYVSYSRLLTAVWNQDETIAAVTGKDSIDLYTSSLALLHQIPLPVSDIGAMDFYGDTLLAVCSDKLYCYNTEGNLVAEVDITGAAVPFDCSISSAGEGKLSLLVDDTLNLIDTDFWQSYTTVEGCLHYDAEHQYIFTVSYLENQTVIGCYKEYSLQELMARAYKQLNGLEPTEELKNRYGLS